MKKRYYIILGVIILALTVVAVSYAFASKPKEDKPIDENTTNPIEEKTINSVVFKNIEKKGDKYVENFDIEINGKKKTLALEFVYEENDDTAHIKTKIGDSEDIYLTNSDEELGVFKNTKYKENYLRNMIKENDFSFIKGADGKSYLSVVVKTNEFMTTESDYLYVLNDELRLVRGDVDYNCINGEAFTIRADHSTAKSDEEPGKSGYADTFGVCDITCYINLKIENDKLYYLVMRDWNYTDPASNDFGSLEERIYTIKNDEFEYTVKNLFTAKYVSGQAC